MSSSVSAPGAAFTSPSPPDYIPVPSPSLPGDPLAALQKGYQDDNHPRPGCLVLADITQSTIMACATAGGGTQWNASVANVTEWPHPHHFCHLANANFTGLEAMRRSYSASNVDNLSCQPAISAASASWTTAVRLPVLTLVVAAVLLLPLQVLAL